MTDIYLVPYHSLRPETRILAAYSGQFALVARAILAGEWPYHNGDDLRALKSLHRRLAEQAKRERASLNTLAVTPLAEGPGGRLPHDG